MSGKTVSPGTSPYTIPALQVVSRSGDALSLPLRLSRNPIEQREAATKAYTDANTGGATFGDAVLPSVPGSWYSHIAPGFPTTTGGLIGNRSIMAPFYAGRPATWDAIGVATDGGFFGVLGFTVWELAPDTFLPTTILWKENSIASINSRFGANTHGRDEATDGFRLSTTSQWLGLAVHAHGTFFGDPDTGWVTIAADTNTSTFGQYTYNIWGHNDTLANGVGANCLGTAIGVDSGVIPTEPSLFQPMDFLAPAIALRFLSAP